MCFVPSGNPGVFGTAYFPFCEGLTLCFSFASMHCLICFLHIIITPNIRKLKTSIKIFIIIQSILIILSTLFIKQHVILDVIGAFLLCLTMYIPVYFYVKKNMSSAKS